MQWEKNFFRPNLQEKCVSAPQDTKCTSKPEQESIFRIVFAGFGGIFRQSLRPTTKKGRQLFWQKSAPPDKILATPMVRFNIADDTFEVISETEEMTVDDVLLIATEQASSSNSSISSSTVHSHSSPQTKRRICMLYSFTVM